MADPQTLTAGQKALFAVALVLAIAACAIELLVLMDIMSPRWGSIGGGLIVLSLALSVIWRGWRRGLRRP